MVKGLGQTKASEPDTSEITQTHAQAGDESDEQTTLNGSRDSEAVSVDNPYPFIFGTAGSGWGFMMVGEWDPLLGDISGVSMVIWCR